MKANRKFREADEAVSAVIGVILMVAITVAIAATVYVYVSGMIGSSPTSTPSVQFVKDDVNDKLTVASADPGDLKWNSFRVTFDGTSGYLRTGDGYTFNASAMASLADTIIVTAGDYFAFNSSGAVSIRHIDTNTLLGTWDFA